jgi:hypothetical protein
MVSQCANPDCRRELHSLRDGKVYQFVLSTKTGGGKRLEHFWLCGDCSKIMIRTCVNQSDVKTERLIQDHAKQKGSAR